MRTLLLGLVLWSCDSKDGDSASATDDSSPGGDDGTPGGDDSSPGGDDSAAVDRDEDGVGAANDCNDDDASIHPGADEIIADGIDQDCDGLDRCYVDDDGDGYGSSTTNAEACDGPGLAAIGEDCDDTDVAYHPGAKESCDDPNDYNCDDSVEYVDDDKDGWGACEECDDTNGDVRPDAPEVPGDHVDQDCDGGETCFADDDGDGFGGASTIGSVDLDCRDPGESPTDEDCLDSGDGAASTWPGIAYADSATACMTDADGDGYGALVPASGVEGGSDCNDAVAGAHPGATEVVGDGIDADCDTTEICFVDSDGDGYGSPKTVSSSDVDCADAGESPSWSDCDDDDPKVWCMHVGNDSEFPDSSSHSPDYLLGTLLVVPTDMTVTAMGLIGKSATGNVRMALYTDSSGAPDGLVMETASTPVPVGILEMPLAKSVAIPAGDYWIMGVFDVTASIGIAFPKGEVVQYRSLSYADPMPGTFGTPSTYSGQVFNYYIVGY